MPEALELKQVTWTSNKAARAQTARDDVANELRHRKLDVKALNEQQDQHWADLRAQLEYVSPWKEVGGRLGVSLCCGLRLLCVLICLE